jgi:hypothetical protein
MKKKSLLGLMGILFLSITFFACSKAPNTVKVLRSMNNAMSLQWADLVDKYGVSYADKDGYTIIGMTLSARNPELLRALIKDGADLYRKYRGEKDPGIYNRVIIEDMYPLRFLIMSGQTVISSSAEGIECVKLLLDTGTELKFLGPDDKNDPLLLAWYYHNDWLIQLLLPAYKKNNMLDYSNYELSLMYEFLYVVLDTMTNTRRDEANEMWNVTKLVVDSGVQISGEALNSALAKRREEIYDSDRTRFDPDAVDLLRSIATPEEF